MDFIAKELARLERALNNGSKGPRHAEIYAARQAVTWAADPGSTGGPAAYLLTDNPSG